LGQLLSLYPAISSSENQTQHTISSTLLTRQLRATSKTTTIFSSATLHGFGAFKMITVLIFASWVVVSFSF